MNFKDWINQTYRDPETPQFTIHNMEVAYIAGKQEQLKEFEHMSKLGAFTKHSDYSFVVVHQDKYFKLLDMLDERNAEIELLRAELAGEDW